VTPDPDRDIIVQAFDAIDALTGERQGERWSVWCGRESVGSFDAEDDALAAARDEAAAAARPVWLMRPGQPPQLVGLDRGLP
jgi:hypothetical protein